MAIVQRLLKTIMPPAMAKAIEAESKKWMFRCPDGHEHSVWELGGVRYKAYPKSKPYLYLCKTCKRWRKMKLYKQD